MAYKLHWLADVLRSAGLSVEEVRGWKTRGQGDMGNVRGILCHHTVGPATGNMPSLDVLTHGRPGLKGPLCQLGLARDGTYYVIAAGRGSHAGRGSWQGITAGNSSFIGIEGENTGLESDMPWPEVQMAAYARGCAAILDHLDAPTIMCAGHREYALPKGRKIDPLFDMDAFRASINQLRGAPAMPPASSSSLRVVGVAPETLNFRLTPGGEKRGELPEGTVVEKLDAGPGWTKVRTNLGFIGWVASRYLQPV